MVNILNADAHIFKLALDVVIVSLFITTFILINNATATFTHISFLMNAHACALYLFVALVLQNFFITATFSNIKLKVNLPVYSNQRCNTVYSARSLTLRSDQLCAGGILGSDSCRGKRKISS